LRSPPCSSKTSRTPPANEFFIPLGGWMCTEICRVGVRAHRRRSPGTRDRHSAPRGEHGGRVRPPHMAASATALPSPRWNWTTSRTPPANEFVISFYGSAWSGICRVGVLARTRPPLSFAGHV
jgi:hypothetical protein